MFWLHSYTRAVTAEKYITISCNFHAVTRDCFDVSNVIEKAIVMTTIFITRCLFVRCSSLCPSIARWYLRYVVTTDLFAFSVAIIWRLYVRTMYRRKAPHGGCTSPMQFVTRSRFVLMRNQLIGPILWGHSGLLCHALPLSLLSSSSSSSLWTSMRRRRATVAAFDSSDTWWIAMRRAAARSGEWAQHFSNASCFKQWHHRQPMHEEAVAWGLNTCKGRPMMRLESRMEGQRRGRYAARSTMRV